MMTNEMFGIMALLIIDLVSLSYVYFRDRRVEQLNDRINTNQMSFSKFTHNWDTQVSQHNENVAKVAEDFKYLSDLNRKANDLLMEATFQLKVLEAEKESKDKKKLQPKRK